MIIDFHTHIYPEKIAAKVIKQAGEKTPPPGCIPLQAYTGGTLEALKASMLDSGIDYSVILPVATSPSQFAAINKYAAEINGHEGIISFGGIHPDTLDYKSELGQIKELGLKGIKLHPDYQETFVDDPKIIDIVNYAAEIGLIVVIHTGKASGYSVIHCTPKGISNLLNSADCSNVVMAHTAGYFCWDDAEKYIIGKSFMIDISCSMEHMGEEQFKRIIKTHGVDKVLFASDSPWGGQNETLANLRNMNFTEDKMEQILYKNGAKLLNLL
jgi:predicted TIM-barrel fold metal-dependent hydrolase